MTAIQGALFGHATPDWRKVHADAQQRGCAGCGQGVLIGLLDGLGPDAAAAEPQALTSLGELLAIAAGRPTYLYTPGRTLDRRRPELIARVDANRDDVIVYAEHRCHAPPPGTKPAPPVPPAKDPDAEPPF